MAVRELDRLPNLGLLYGKALVTSLRQGKTLPGGELVLRDWTVDREHLAAYDRLCGFTVSDRLPATYLHVLAFPLAVQLMASPEFPLPLPGLVHIANRITQHRPVRAGEPVSVRVGLADLRDHEKGTAFDFVSEAAVDSEVVWREVSTNLQRGSGTGRSGGDRDGDAPPPVARWRVPADTGRRYAAVSGDRNPIHLWPLTARAFGFARPIAHGMWTKARCLAALDGRLGDRFEVTVDFKAPLAIPATVRFAARESDGRWAFAVRALDGKPHLEGAAVPG